MTRKRRKVIMAGCGGMSGAWIRPALKRNDIEFVGFMDINETAAREKAKAFELYRAQSMAPDARAGASEWEGGGGRGGRSDRIADGPG